MELIQWQKGIHEGSKHALWMVFHSIKSGIHTRHRVWNELIQRRSGFSKLWNLRVEHLCVFTSVTSQVKLFCKIPFVASNSMDIVQLEMNGMPNYMLQLLFGSKGVDWVQRVPLFGLSISNESEIHFNNIDFPAILSVNLFLWMQWEWAIISFKSLLIPNSRAVYSFHHKQSMRENAIDK